MATGTIDVVTGAPGSLTAVVVDPSGNVLGPPAQIEVTNAWRVDFTWTMGGLVPFLSGNWDLQVVLEGMGGNAPEFEMGTTTPIVSGQTSYGPVSVNFPASSVTLGTEDSFTFHSIALLTARDATGKLIPIGGYADLGIVQIFD